MANQKQKASPPLPYSTGAEQSVLGSLMLDNERWDEVVLIIGENDFFNLMHRVIFREMARLVGAGQPIDLITLSDSLEKQGSSREEHIFAYLAEMAKNTPSAANTVAYCEIVARDSRARQLAALGADLTQQVSQPHADIPQIMEMAERRIIDIAEKAEPQKTITVVDGLEKVVAELEVRHRSADGITGTATGFIELDAKTCGLQNGDLILLAARPSMGKTALGLNIITGTLNHNSANVTQIYSLEQPSTQLLMRLISSIGFVPLQNLRSGDLTDEQWSQIGSAVETITKWQKRLVIDDTSDLTPAMLRVRARRNARKYGKPALIMVDYLQLMRCPGMENRTQEIAEISRSLKSLAKEMDCPVVALSQLNRSLEQRADKRPNNGDLRDSGSLEQDADVTLFIYRDEVYNPNSPDKGLAEIIMGKQRQGPIGTIKVQFDGRFTRFTNMPFDARGGY
ncbi:SPI-7-type island replicative DNA helicase [Pectobacterium aroidearum]|uniref:SPI-7-type island replicative DNA helicase n=1 Tax=Pectobacterium aroidearum TaxID=1201031 RepID=UPI0032EF3AF5